MVNKAVLYFTVILISFFTILNTRPVSSYKVNYGTEYSHNSAYKNGNINSDLQKSSKTNLDYNPYYAVNHVLNSDDINIITNSYSYPCWIRRNYRCYLPTSKTNLFPNTCFGASIKFIEGATRCCMVANMKKFYAPERYSAFHKSPEPVSVSGANHLGKPNVWKANDFGYNYYNHNNYNQVNPVSNGGFMTTLAPKSQTTTSSSSSKPKPKPTKTAQFTTTTTTKSTTISAPITTPATTTVASKKENIKNIIKVESERPYLTSTEIAVDIIYSSVDPSTAPSIEVEPTGDELESTTEPESAWESESQSGSKSESQEGEESESGSKSGSGSEEESVTESKAESESDSEMTMTTEIVGAEAGAGKFPEVETKSENGRLKNKTNAVEDNEISHTIEPKPLFHIKVFAYNNFEEPSTTIPVYRKCRSLPLEWQNRISSMNTMGACVEVCQYSNCAGSCILVSPGTYGHNRLRDVNFDKRITSIRACLDDYNVTVQCRV